MTDKWFIVDCHNQFVPQEGILKSRGTTMDLTSGPQAATQKRVTDIEGKLRVMDEAGIDMAVIHQSPLSLLGLDFCRAMNDGNARTAKEYPGRFIACAHIPLDGGGSPEACKEVDRAINDLGLKGVALLTSTEKVTLSSEELFPLYEKINQLDVPVVVHPNNIRIGERVSRLGSGLRVNMHRAIAVETENTEACVDVMFGVLNKFPDLKFLMPHHGGALPFWQGRMMSQCIPDGWKIPDNVKDIPKTPRIRRQLGLDKHFAALFEKLYFDTSGFQGWMPITQATLLTVRADRLCFGTDYGFEMLEAQDIKGFIDDIKKLNMPEADRRNILGENIRTLFKLHE